MTAPRARRLLAAELYVLICTGLATLMVLDLAPTWALGVVLVLLLPAGIVVFAIAINIVFLTEGLPDGWVWQLAFVLFVAALAVLQAWMFRTTARNWRTPEPEVRRRPVTTGADTGL